MKKLTITLALLGVGLAGGGVGILHLQNANYMSPELWSVFGNFLTTSPRGVLEAASGGPTSGVIRGLLLTTSGGAILALSAILPVAGIVLGGAAGGVGRVSSGMASKLPALKRSGRKTTKAKPVRMKTFAEKKARLESGWMEKLRPAIAKVAAIIAAKISEARARKAAAKKVVTTSLSIAPAAVDTSFLKDLRAWHENVRQTAGRDLSTIEVARELQARATPEVLAMVRAEDAMGGELLIRMMTAWAAKSDDAFVPKAPVLAPPRDAEATMLSHAINDVLANGIEVADSDEEGVDFDDEDGFVDNDLFLQATGRSAAAAATEKDLEESPRPEEDDQVEDAMSIINLDEQRDKEVDLDDDDEGEGWSDEDESEGGGDDLQSNIFTLLVEALRLKTLAEEVREDTSEWPVHLASQADRVSLLSETFDKLDVLIEGVDEGDLTTWIEEGYDQPEWQWLGNVSSSLNDERAAIMEMIVAGGNASAPSSDDEDDEDLNAGFGVPVRRTAQADGPQDAADDHASDDQTEDAAGDDDGVENHSPDDEDELPSAEESNAPQVVETEDALPPLEADPEEPQDEAMEAEDETQEEDIFEGQDLAIGELEEVQMSDEFLGKWGMSAKSAGAFEAKLVNVILGRNGGRRTVIGTVHMTAFFKNDGGDLVGQLNLIFRYVPEGEWSMVTDEGVRMVDRRGNFVGVKEELLGHLSAGINTTVIHFHGPGVKEPIEVKLKPNLYVSGRHWTADEIRRAAIG